VGPAAELTVGLLFDVFAWFGDPENIWGDRGYLKLVREHLQLSAVVIVAAVLVAVPIGLVMGHTGKGGALAINISNIGRALPSFAVLVIAYSALGLGTKPAFVALFALADPPIVTNTYTAIRGVDPEVREAAEGMGLTGGQVLRRVELPMGMPLIMAGIRTSSVQVVATATLAAYVGGGGLGRLIRSGLATQNSERLIGGALLVAGLSVAVELALGLVQRAVTPAGLQAGRKASTGAEAVPALPGAAAAAGRTTSVAG
jgi:osmoprotectant transport system permease protein